MIKVTRTAMRTDPAKRARRWVSRWRYASEEAYQQAIDRAEQELRACYRT